MLWDVRMWAGENTHGRTSLIGKSFCNHLVECACLITHLERLLKFFHKSLEQTWWQLAWKICKKKKNLFCSERKRRVCFYEGFPLLLFSDKGNTFMYFSSRCRFFKQFHLGAPASDKQGLSCFVKKKLLNLFFFLLSQTDVWRVEAEVSVATVTTWVTEQGERSATGEAWGGRLSEWSNRKSSALHVCHLKHTHTHARTLTHTHSFKKKKTDPDCKFNGASLWSNTNN